MVLVMLLTLYSGSMAFAATIVVDPPKNYQVADIGYDGNGNWYANLTWQFGTFPPGTDEGQFIDSFHEIEYGTGRRITNSVQMTIPGTQRERVVYDDYDPEINPDSNALKPGHIYESNLIAACSVVDTNDRVLSQRSNVIKFITGVRFHAELIPGTNDIKISWDDVWDTNGRIDYRIYISDISDQSFVPITETIRGARIGQPDSPPVTINAAERKLEYIFTGAHPGRMYSIKVVPIPGPDVVVVPEAEIPEIPVNTNILIRAYRVGYTPDGDAIWNLVWDPVIIDENIKQRNYYLFRYTSKDDNNPKQYVLPDITSYQIIVPKGDTTPYSFSVEARVITANNRTLEFKSGARVELREIIPQTPEAPEIVDGFPENPDITYDGLLTAHSATVMWKVPYNGEGIGDKYIDTDVVMISIWWTISAKSIPSKRKIK